MDYFWYAKKRYEVVLIIFLLLFSANTFGKIDSILFYKKKSKKIVYNIKFTVKRKKLIEMFVALLNNNVPIKLGYNINILINEEPKEYKKKLEIFVLPFSEYVYIKERNKKRKAIPIFKKEEAINIIGNKGLTINEKVFSSTKDFKTLYTKLYIKFSMLDLYGPLKLIAKILGLYNFSEKYNGWVQCRY